MRLWAENLAREMARFPQVCMRADRMSCHRQWGKDLAEAGFSSEEIEELAAAGII